MQIHGELATIPGYVDAVERENKIRNAAMLNLNTRICGIEVRQMTLRHWLILDGLDCPFLKGDVPDPKKKHVKDFLWVLSPKFSYGESFRKWWFYRRIGKLKYAEVVMGIMRYLEDTLQDQPPSTGSKSKEWTPPQYSFPIYFTDVICERYGWDDEKIEGYNLKKIFQIIKRIRMKGESARGENPVGWNPSDKIKWAHIRKVRAEREAAKKAKTDE